MRRLPTGFSGTGARTAASLILPCVCVLACTEPPVERAAVLTLRDSGGVVIIENVADTADLPMWSLDSVPELRIGVIDGDPATRFRRFDASARRHGRTHMKGSFTTVKRTLLAVGVSAALGSSTIVAGQSDTPHQAFLDALVGVWDLNVYSDTAAGFRDVGQRTFRRGHADLVLEWEERHTTSNNVGHGFLGFDAAAGKYFMIGVYSAPGASLVFLSGAPLDDSAIRWIPVDVRADQTAANRNLIQSDLRRVSPDTLAWRAFDGRWEFLLVRRSGRERSSLP